MALTGASSSPPGSLECAPPNAGPWCTRFSGSAAPVHRRGPGPRPGTSTTSGVPCGCSTVPTTTTPTPDTGRRARTADRAAPPAGWLVSGRGTFEAAGRGQRPSDTRAAGLLQNLCRGGSFADARQGFRGALWYRLPSVERSDRRHGRCSDQRGCPMQTRTDSAVPARSLAARLHVSRRTLQIALGVLWVVDGLLKFQPKLFNPGLVSTVIRPMAAGQPTVLGATISHMANFLSHEAAMWDVLFGLVEIAIGVGILFRRSLKPALVASFVWGLGIYIFGEGLGMVLYGPHLAPPGCARCGVLLHGPGPDAVAAIRGDGRGRGRHRVLGRGPGAPRRNRVTAGLGGHLDVRGHHLDVPVQPDRQRHTEPDGGHVGRRARLVRAPAELVRARLHRAPASGWR